MDGEGNTYIGGEPSGESSLSTFIDEQLRQKCRLMLRYLTDHGIDHPSLNWSTDRPADLIAYYNALAQRVKPANPILLLDSDTEGERNSHDKSAAWITGITSVVSMVCLIGTGWTLSALGPDVTTHITGFPQPTGRIEKVLFDVSVAGLGAVLSVFTQVQDYVSKGLYNKRHNFTYAAKFFSGIIAGFILAELLSLSLGPPVGGQTASGLASFGVGAAALIGGAFAPVVYQLIRRLADMAEQTFSDQVEARIAAVRKETELLASMQTLTGQSQLLTQFTAYRKSLAVIDPELARKLDKSIEETFSNRFQHTNRTDNNDLTLEDENASHELNDPRHKNQPRDDASENSSKLAEVSRGDSKHNTGSESVSVV